MVARKGEIIFRARKQLLPSYDVFDETRYFEPGSPSELYELKDLKFGVTVCEDVWSEEVTEYDIEPVDDLLALAAKKQETIHGIINISASPFQRNKEEIRKSIFQKISRTIFYPFSLL